jgi:hypothetical protein
MVGKVVTAILSFKTAVFLVVCMLIFVKLLIKKYWLPEREITPPSFMQMEVTELMSAVSAPSHRAWREAENTMV